jgi:amino acid transporter
MPVAHVNDIELNYKLEGDGEETIVLVNGLADDLETWVLRTPAAAAVAFVAPSIVIAVVSTAFTNPITASGLLGTYGIFGLIIMYLAANVALIVEWVKFRRRGIRKNPWLWVVIPVIGAAVLGIPIWGDLRPGQPSPFNTLP